MNKGKISNIYRLGDKKDKISKDKISNICRLGDEKDKISNESRFQDSLWNRWVGSDNDCGHYD